MIVMPVLEKNQTYQTLAETAANNCAIIDAAVAVEHRQRLRVVGERPLAVRGFAGKHHALLLANHGPVVAGSSLSAAADAVEELEATAKLFLLLRHEKVRCLTPDAHLAAEHFKTFDRTVAPWIAAKAVRTYDRLCPQ